MTEAILLVGGQGTRLRPVTVNTPKPMVPPRVSRSSPTR